MKKWRHLLLTGTALFMISGCGKAVYIDTQRFFIAEGIDLNEENRLVLYSSIPVFSREATVKNKLTTVTVDTIRQAKMKLESRLNGNVAPGKLQSILIGKKLLKQKSVFPYLDVFFRDPKNEINANVIVVDGTLEEVLHTKMDDKGRVGNVIKQLVESTYKGGISPRATLQKYHQQMMDTAITPSIPEMRVEKNDLVIAGAALLHEDGTYATSLGTQESSLLLLLQRDTNNPIPLSFHLSPELFHTDDEMSYVSLEIKRAKLSIDPEYENNHLTLRIRMNVQIGLLEMMFHIDLKKQTKQLELAIEQELQRECQDLITKAQKNQIDPFGFGIIMRAKEYKDWKKIEGNWGGALSEATVTISPQVTIQNTGVAN
ncbi:hypothetical protein A8709_04300 [Paenibacillus pectinilyticus]|uniref:Uncharacterized protein n=1 Tax=Paenibacillus pectinilyticus TaxID=512399 RepID=A0A1C0ZS88_9BACL|nr:Ger(x)C family spore germination protein [Paenibacillus pectinilyticus]OCT10932.1 hypothetical protein A8709_04300 [Paenibacillus pectinilyticus]